MAQSESRQTVVSQCSVPLPVPLALLSSNLLFPSLSLSTMFLKCVCVLQSISVCCPARTLAFFLSLSLPPSPRTNFVCLFSPAMSISPHYGTDCNVNTLRVGVSTPTHSIFVCFVLFVCVRLNTCHAKLNRIEQVVRYDKSPARRSYP